MRFEIVGNVTNVYMTVAIEGSSKATVSVDDVYREGATFKTGKVLSFFIEYIREGSNMASLTVKGADVDEYITLSVPLVENTEPCEGLAADNYLVPNDS